MIAFLDFFKAYDTVDRNLLYSIMDAMGVNAEFVRWVRILLSSTQFVSVVNGFKSRPFPTYAGVRQGCPLSPFLYLLVAHALQCWLRACDIGVRVAGLLCAAVQHADDTQVLLPSLDPSCVQRFVEHMNVFRSASGQTLNLSKCQLLPVGSHPGTVPAGTSVAGIKVVDAATAFGITINNHSSC